MSKIEFSYRIMDLDENDPPIHLQTIPYGTIFQGTIIATNPSYGAHPYPRTNNVFGLYMRTEQGVLDLESFGTREWPSSIEPRVKNYKALGVFASLRKT